MFHRPCHYVMISAQEVMAIKKDRPHSIRTLYGTILLRPVLPTAASAVVAPLVAWFFPQSPFAMSLFGVFWLLCLLGSRLYSGDNAFLVAATCFLLLVLRSWALVSAADQQVRADAVEKRGIVTECDLDPATLLKKDEWSPSEDPEPFPDPVSAAIQPQGGRWSRARLGRPSGALQKLDRPITGIPAADADAKRKKGGRSVRLAIVRCDDGERIQLRLHRSILLESGDRVWFKGKLLPTEEARDPGGFSERRWLAAKAVFLKTEKLGPGSVVRLGQEGQGLYGLAVQAGASLKRWSCASFLSWLGPEAGGLASGMILGADELISDDLKDDFKKVGLAHLLAVSGSNTGMMTGFMVALLTALGPRHRWRQVGKLAVLGLFGFVTGWDVSVTRAIVMQSAAAVCALLDRKGDRLNHLVMALVTMVVWRPFVIFNLGLWMSLVVTAAIIIFMPKVNRSCIMLELDAGRARLLAPALSFVAVSLIAFLAGLPFSVAMQKGVVPLALVVNLFAVPFAGFIATAGLCLLATTALPLLPSVCSLALSGSLGLLIGIVRHFARDAYMIHLRAAVWLPLSILLFAIPMILGTRGRLRRSIVGIAAVTAVLLALRPLLIRTPGLRVICLDVGQGDSILLMKAGRAILVDAGFPTAAERQVVPALEALGVTNLDLIIASHLDNDHVGGIATVVEAVGVDRVILPPPAVTARRREDLLELCQRRGIGISTLYTGDRLDWVEGTVFQVLSPSDYLDGGNEDSVVLHLKEGDFDMLLTGDAGIKTETRIMASWDQLPYTTPGGLPACEVLKVGHHGSRYSTSLSWLERVTPSVAAISVGQTNTYGHPHPDTLKRLADVGALVLRTDQAGAIVIEVGKKSYTTYQWMDQRDRTIMDCHETQVEGSGRMLTSVHSWTKSSGNSEAGSIPTPFRRMINGKATKKRKRLHPPGARPALGRSETSLCSLWGRPVAYWRRGPPDQRAMPCSGGGMCGLRRAGL